MPALLRHTILLTPWYPAMILLGIAVYAPLGNTVLGYPNGEVAYRLLEPLCHQLFDRSLTINGHPMGLCARCTGGYLGLAVASLLCVFSYKKMISRSVLYSIGSTLLIVAIVEALVKPYDTNVWRFFSGFAGGAGFGLMIEAVLILALSPFTKK